MRKPTNWLACALVKTQISLETQSDLRIGLHLKAAKGLRYFHANNEALIRLNRCRVRSVSSHGAIPFCWLSLVVAHLYRTFIPGVKGPLLALK